MDDSLCPERQQPLRQDQCSLLTCAQWETGAWQPCLVTCGNGVQTRVVHCVRSANKKSIVIHDRECNVCI